MKSATRFLAILAILANAGLASCALSPSPIVALTAPSTEATAPALQTLTPQPQFIDLPPPRLKGTLTLEEALAKRRSVRQYSAKALTMDELGQLLWAAQGITHPAGLRTAPSAGALYPLEVYAVTPDGVYLYEPQGHRLALQVPGDVRTALYEAALQQGAVREAPAVIVITAVYERTANKYGEERSPRYAHLEAGHAAQNILLQAVALNLGAVPIGAFYDDQVKKVLELPGDQQPLYLIPAGHPSEQ
jgi:SagB-type dehydrogenase family enzyme